MGNSFILWDRVPKELQFILELIRNQNIDASLLRDKESLHNIDWTLFLDLVMHHRLYPIVYSKVKMIDGNFIPDGIVQSIYEKYKKNTFEMLHLSAEMVHVNNLFSENGIRMLVLKGPVLATDLYGDISLRTCRDLDLLISINDLEIVENALLKMGYQKDESFQIEPVLNDWKWRHHHLSFIHSEKRVKLEIHWRLNPGPGKEPAFDDLWERKRTISHLNQSIYYLGREDLFYFLTTHGARHGWSRLRWLVDIHQLVNQGMDWSKAIMLLTDYQSLHIGSQALILSDQLLKTPVPDQMLPFTNEGFTNRLVQSTLFYLEHMVNLHSEPLPETIAKYHERYLYSLMPYQQKFLYLMSIFYPSITDVKTLQLPKSLYFLYFPLRPIFLVMRKTRKHLV